MGAEESLTVMAEVAVTLAGFSGLVAVFGFREITLGVAVNRIIWVFVICFVVVVAAFLPFVLTDFTTNDEVIWGIPAALMGVFLLAIVANFSRKSNRHSRAFPRTTTLVLVIASLIGVWLVSAALGLVHHQGAGVVLIGQLWLTSHAGYLFLTALLKLQIQLGK